VSPSSILDEVVRLAQIRKDVHKTSKAIIDHIINAQLTELKEQLTNGKS